MSGRAAVAAVIACIAFAEAAEAARTRPPIECVKPSAIDASTYAPIDLELSIVGDADLPTLAVLLNGTNVTSAFAIDPPVGSRRKAAATDVWDGIVLPGANTMQASIVKAGHAYQCTRPFQTQGDPYADSVTSYTIGTNGGYPGTGFLPGIVTGPPKGSGPSRAGSTSSRSASAARSCCGSTTT